MAAQSQSSAPVQSQSSAPVQSQSSAKLDQEYWQKCTCFKPCPILKLSCEIELRKCKIYKHYVICNKCNIPCCNTCNKRFSDTPHELFRCICHMGMNVKCIDKKILKIHGDCAVFEQKASDIMIPSDCLCDSKCDRKYICEHVEEYRKIRMYLTEITYYSNGNASYELDPNYNIEYLIYKRKAYLLNKRKADVLDE